MAKEYCIELYEPKARIWKRFGPYFNDRVKADEALNDHPFTIFTQLGVQFRIARDHTEDV